MNKKGRKSVIWVMIATMVFSLFTGIAPIGSVKAAEEVEADQIGENELRIHYDIGNYDLSDIGAWLWGDVVNPSDEVSDWPNGTWFEEGGTDPYGAYIDVAITENAQNIGLKINNRAGDGLTDDISIDILSEQMDEVWLTNDGKVYYYEPKDFEENIIRVHFQTDAESYQPWGVWSWGDVAAELTEWPTDAHPFTDQQVGDYGAYVDIPLKENPASIGFLLVEMIENGQQTNDFSFADLDNHRQIFLKDGDETVYTNPYYVSTEVEEEPPEEHEGEADITVDGSVNRSFTYNDHAVLSVNITNNSELGIQSIYADTTALGGEEFLPISPDLNEVTLSVSHDIEPGSKTIPVTVVDDQGGTYSTEVTATVAPREVSEATTDWDESIIYFMLTDRFYDGDASNNDPYQLNYSSYDNQQGTYQGGDFKGVMEKLDYLDELGVNTIWVTPIVENVGYDVNHNVPEGSYFAYHGYWAEDFEKLNPHLGTLEEFHQLIDAAAERDIKIMADVVLNHAGYGLNQSAVNPPAGYPTEEDRDRFAGMFREQSGSDDETMSLSGLPDFQTEEAEVRNQLVEWQKNWIEKSTTSNGNSLAYYRVDTVKHVDDTTWQHFRNELTKEKPSFQLIGEAWGAGKSDDQGYLNSGMMDSLLDFEFKATAASFVNGNLESANQALTDRNNTIDNTALLGQFLGSHDEDGFLHSLQGDEGKFKLAATLQLTAKGQPVIYYGEELGQSGANNWPIYDNRYNFAWDQVENNEMLTHYQKNLDFRNQFSDILAKGTRTTVAGSDQDQYLLVERVYENDKVYLGLNVAETKQTIRVKVDNKAAVMTDHYANKTYQATETESGEYVITFDLPAITDGGTALLTVADGTLLSGETSDEEPEPTTPETGEVPAGHLRVHFPVNDNELGLWVWGDVTNPSETVGAWPNAALSFKEENTTEYGRFVDIELNENAKQVGMLLNNTSGENLSGDLFADILAPEMNQVWITEDYEVYPYRPLSEEDGKIRVNFYQEEESYNNYGLWTWGDVSQPTENWPDGAHFLADDRLGLKGSYVDLPLADNPGQINFLFLNKETDWQTGDLSFSDFGKHTQIFVRKGDDTVYTNPYFVKEEGLVNGEILSDKKIELSYTSVAGLAAEELPEAITVTDKEGNDVAIQSVTISEVDQTVLLHGTFAVDKAPFTITHDGRKATASAGWRLKDEMYGYDGKLGLEVHDASNATLRIWSPSADNVSVVLYDKDDPDKIVKENISMTKGEKGVWQAELNQATTGIDHLLGYYYHFAIEREGETVLALDPYAKSMAEWTNAGNKVGKAAIVDPSQIGPELDFAKIDHFEKREDAIIYEVHVRDFTSDPSIDEELEAQFGTFASFVEKLDYIEDLGVTHIQLLPVMSYYFADEMSNGERMLEYSSADNNYNWGYDPQSYFSLTGMYSEDPTDPAKRIEEFKNLIQEIHRRDMGVILDVVYNHTAQTHIFEDLEPNYYHFMNADGTPRESFGGGRLGTTHKMARRILVDSVKYWVDEFKVDGFRFDMMGDHDAESIQIAYDEAKQLNPNIVMIGEGWRTFAGDENYPDVQPADQDWMQDTDSVASFSDEFRNELKSGFGSEGQPRFITGGARDIQTIFNNITANPGNFTSDDPGDVVTYIAAHDNLTLHDVIAQSIKKDPVEHKEEIHQRIRLGNLMVLTSQGTSFIHAGQEYGRTKQFRHEDYKGEVAEPPNKSTLLTDENGDPFEYPYFIHDSYDSTDAVNMFDWEKATNEAAYPVETTTRAYTKGLIELRRSTDAFHLATKQDIEEKVKLLDIPEIKKEDLVVAYQTEDSQAKEKYYVFINADNQTRTLSLKDDLTNGEVVVAGDKAGTKEIADPQGVKLTKESIEIAPLSSVVIRLSDEKDEDDMDTDKPGDSGSDSSSDDSSDSSDSDSGMKEEDTPSPNEGDGIIVVDSDAIEVSEETDENGKEVLRVTLQSKIILEQIKKSSQLERLEIKLDADFRRLVTVSIVGKIIEAMKQKNENATVYIESNLASYQLPVKELGELEENAEVEVLMEILPDEEVAELFTDDVRGPVVRYEVNIINGENVQSLSTFDQYVERSVKLEEQSDPDKSTAVLIKDQDEISFVPSIFTDNSVVIKRRSNSLYTVMENEAELRDIANHWATDHIQTLANKWIVSGYADQTYKPNKKISRAEFARLIAVSLALETENTAAPAFTDVAGDEWFAGSVQALVEADLLSGYTDGSFHPNQSITRAEIASILSRVAEFIGADLKRNDHSLADLSDVDQIPEWAAEEIETVLQLEIMQGYNSAFTPNDDATRAEMAVALYNLLERVEFIN
ncbi:pullulanase, extracellular [Gracilibacillus ureilyticus]|uniref:pullulanase n=1 Tax=Gracilibacillus ureilyticus TaxID=531814 RepID=A0A1H9UKN2_9BACI|nr:pullulanase [Gracilibacillus ureilyticus]SES10016.1 pullulanase, extracellular [Gracilibacillus ureilyticus]